MSCDNMTHNCITDTELTQMCNVGPVSLIPRKRSCDTLLDIGSSRGGGRGKGEGSTGGQPSPGGRGREDDMGKRVGVRWDRPTGECYNLPLGYRGL